jgi:VanZ family protein
MKKYSLTVLLPWLWLFIVLIASLIPKPKYYIRTALKAILKLVGQNDMDKNVHFIFYFLLTFLFILAYEGKLKRIIILFFIIVFSGAIEIIQPISSRSRDVLDFKFNLTGCLLGFTIAILVDFINKRLKIRE